MPTKTLLPGEVSLRYCGADVGQCRGCGSTQWTQVLGSAEAMGQLRASPAGHLPRSSLPQPSRQLCPEETCEASLAPTLPSVVSVVSISGPGQGWRNSDYETGSEEEDGWPAGGAGRGPFSLRS